jgi:hypothetical protein
VQYDALVRRRSYDSFNQAYRGREGSGGKLCQTSFALVIRGLQTGPFEKIEDEYDIMIGQEAYDEYVADQRKSRPVSELWKECDI